MHRPIPFWMEGQIIFFRSSIYLYSNTIDIVFEKPDNIVTLHTQVFFKFRYLTFKYPLSIYNLELLTYTYI